MITLYMLNIVLTIFFQRAEIAVDTNQVNSAIGTHHPDVSKWPIKEYEMPRQKDG